MLFIHNSRVQMRMNRVHDLGDIHDVISIAYDQGSNAILLCIKGNFKNEGENEYLLTIQYKELLHTGFSGHYIAKKYPSAASKYSVTQLKEQHLTISTGIKLLTGGIMLQSKNWLLLQGIKFLN